MKKVLDKRSARWYHIKVRCEGGGRLDESFGFELSELKSSGKSLKKDLTATKRYDTINKFLPLRRGVHLVN